MWCICRFIFKFDLPRLFLNCDYLFCLICKTLKITIKEQREKRDRKTRKIKFNSKKEFSKGSFRLTSPPISRNIQFWSKHNPSWTGLLSVLYPLGNFGIFLENLNNEINIVTYNLFLFLYYSHKYNKNDSEANFCEIHMYLQCRHYRTTNQLKKKFQDGNSAIVRKLSIRWEKEMCCS